MHIFFLLICKNYSINFCNILQILLKKDTANVVRIHFLFSMLGLHAVFVLNKGRLVGVIGKSNFDSEG